MDFQSAMETFAEAWVAANAGAQTQALALTRPKSPKKELSLSPAPSIINERRDSLNRTPTGLQSISRTTTSTPVELLISRSPKHSISSSNNNNNTINNSNNNSNLNINNNLLGNNNNNTVNSNNNSNSGMITPSHLSPPAHQSNTNINSSSNSNNNNNNYSNQIQPPTISSCHHSNSTSSLHSFSGGNLTTKFMNSNINNNSNNNSILENGNNNNNSNCGISNISKNEQVLPSPTMERKEFDFAKVNSKSLPLHCIVESFTSLQASMINDIRSPWKRRSNIETDSYVIIPSVTPFCDIVKTALQSLGYSIDIANTAKGTIIIKNWKPLALEKVTDSPLVSVGEILGELTSVITLRISVIRTKPSSVNEIKDKLLKLLVLQSHTALRSTGCPLDEILLSQICRNTTFPFEVSDDLRRKFDQWWSNQITPQTNPIAPNIMPPFVNPNTANVKNEFTARHLHVGSREQLENHHHNPHHNMIVHPALQTVHSQYPSQKTRMRTSFDPEMELPKLQKWFQENPHPSRQQIQSYVIQLNSLESRRGRKPLDVNNVVYWFKNARAAQKRAEIRGHGLGNGYGPSAGLLMSHPDYMKSPHSMKSEDIDNLSQHSDDMDDEMDRPASPQVPLSLTTHERNRTPHTIDDVKIENDRSNSSPPNMSTSQDMGSIKNERSESELMNHSGELRAQNNDSPKTSPTSEELDMDDADMTPNDFRSPSPDSRRDLPFPIVPNSMFSHSIMYMSHYIPAAMGQGHHATPNSSPNALGPVGLNLSNLSNDERRKRNRTFIDPVTEVPKLEQWFAMNTHPSHNLILKYTEDLNRMPYRQKFPRLESKNVQFWFKNRRAKCKRLKMSLYDTSQLAALSTFHPGIPSDHPGE